MKINGKTKVVPFPSIKKEKSSGDSVVKQLKPGEYEVSHWQSVRLSLNYNSAEAGYSVKTTVRGTRADAKERLRLLEKVVEARLAPKISEQLETLRQASQATSQ